jgi:hypothetical protein
MLTLDMEGASLIIQFYSEKLPAEWIIWRFSAFLIYTPVPSEFSYRENTWIRARICLEINQGLVAKLWD